MNMYYVYKDKYTNRTVEICLMLFILFVIEIRWLAQ